MTTQKMITRIAVTVVESVSLLIAYYFLVAFFGTLLVYLSSYSVAMHADVFDSTNSKLRLIAQVLVMLIIAAIGGIVTAKSMFGVSREDALKNERIFNGFHQ